MKAPPTLAYSGADSAITWGGGVNAAGAPAAEVGTLTEPQRAALFSAVSALAPTR
jgi:hypothetical protein